MAAPEKIWAISYRKDWARNPKDFGSCSYIGDVLDGPDPDGSTEYIRADLFANVLGALAEADAFILQETRFSNEGRTAIIAEASEALGVKIRLTKEGDK